MECNIILIGMPGTGKTTIGKKLAEKLSDYTLIDTDSLIEKTTGMKVSEIFQKHSEDYFRKLEYDTIKLITVGKNKIISIGGGAFENPDTRGRLLNFGKVFYLKTDFDVLYYRISKDNERPLLAVNNPKQTLENMIKKREENYMQAHYTIDVSSKDEEEIVNYILGSMNEKNSQS